MKAWLAFVALMSCVTAEAGVTVVDAWARATVPGQQVGGVFMKLASSGKAVLLGASCGCAATVQIHETVEKNGIASMRERKLLPLAPGSTVEFKPGGLHFMLFGLGAPLKAGEEFPLTLTVEENGKRSQHVVQVRVRALGTDAAAHDHDHNE